MTLNALLLACVYALLRRYSRQTDICVGMPVANRRERETEGLIGFFVNLVPVRVAGRVGEWSGEELVRAVQGAVLEAQEGQDVPFEKVVDAVQPARDLTRNPIFQVLVNYVATGSRPVPSLGACRIEELDYDYDVSKFDLSFSFLERDAGELVGFVTCAEEVYAREAAARIAEHLRALLGHVVTAPGRLADDVELMSAAERATVLCAWNDTARAYPARPLIHEIVAAQARRTPERVALVCEGRRLLYGELDEQATRLAVCLQHHGVRPDVLVGICAERSPEMVVAILGVLKAGGAYLPLDPEYPEARLRFMLDDSGASVLLTQQALLPRLALLRPRAEGLTLALDGDWPVPPAVRRGPPPQVGRDHLAYMIYTSGSTGVPKGAMNTHGGLLNRLQWMQEAYGLTGDDRVLQKTPFSFDVSVWEFLWPLAQGARLVLAQPGGHRDPAYLSRLIADQHVTTLHFVPSMLRSFLDGADLEACGSVRQVLCSGEALPAELQERFFARLACKLHNLYGPTEAAIDVSSWECRPGDRTVPIGRPIANTQLFVLDEGLRPTPVGIPGELHIAGAGLARGYWRRPGLTAERFVPNPFDAGGARMYRTGDLARHRGDGSLEYLGRLDQQVKVRGVRIELGEIEALLLRQPAVRDAAVVARERRAGETILMAYVVPADGGLDVAALRAAVSRELPGYMLPDAFAALPELPLTPSGKVDRRALGRMDVAPERARVYVAPRTVAERELVAIWQEVLQRDGIGVHDNFFEIGGNSLLAIQISTRVRRWLAADVSVREIFEHPTVCGLSELVGRREAVESGEL